MRKLKEFIKKIEKDKLLFSIFCCLILVFFIKGCVFKKNKFKNEAILYDSMRSVSYKVTKKNSEYDVKRYRYTKSINEGTAFFGRSNLFYFKTMSKLFVSNTAIFIESPFHDQKLIYQHMPDTAANDFSVRIWLSGISPNGKKLIFFIDRRESSHEFDWDSDPMGPPMLYPNFDEVSGFYLLDLDTLVTKKLQTKGSFLTWIDNKFVLIQDYIPIWGKENKYSYNVLDTTENRTVNRIVGRIFGKTKIRWAEFDSIQQSLESITGPVDSASANILKPSPFDSSILGIYPQSKKNKFYLNGKKIFEINSWNRVMDAGWLTHNEIAIISEDKVGVFSISKNQLIFEKSHGDI